MGEVGLAPVFRLSVISGRLTDLRPGAAPLFVQIFGLSRMPSRICYMFLCSVPDPSDS